jgi:Uma2 family endonuclease
MSSAKPLILLRLEYEEAAEAYLRSLPPEHFMEATPQATQREITLESFALVHARRPDVQHFNELLIQYPKGKKRKGQVVPDNMVVVDREPIKAVLSFDTPLQPFGPFLVLEYVCKSSRGRDYEERFRKYERDLRVPYCLLFYGEEPELTPIRDDGKRHIRSDNQGFVLYRHDGEQYAAVPPDARGRCPIPELELEVALLNRWVRYWFRGELLPLPAELLRNLDEARRQTDQANRARLAAEEEVARLRAELERLRSQPREGT